MHMMRDQIQVHSEDNICCSELHASLNEVVV